MNGGADCTSTIMARPWAAPIVTPVLLQIPSIPTFLYPWLALFLVNVLALNLTLK